MSKFKCELCGAPTDNDQSFIVPACLTGGEPKRYETHRCDKCDKALDRQIAWESEGETINEDNVICPYCGYQYDDYDGYQFDEGKTEEVECPECSRKFDIEVETRRTYSTKRSICEMPDTWEEDTEE